MNFFVMLWRWLSSPHCVCGSDSPSICHAHSPRYLESDPLNDGSCCVCDHALTCHQLNN